MPIVWYSKRQHTVETSTFSAEFIALKVCLEAIEHLRFKLQCFGVPLPVGEPTHVFSTMKVLLRIHQMWNRRWTRNILPSRIIIVEGRWPLVWFHLLILVHMIILLIVLPSDYLLVQEIICLALGHINRSGYTITLLLRSQSWLQPAFEGTK